MSDPTKWPLLLTRMERDAVERTLDAWVRTDLSDPNLPALKRVIGKLRGLNELQWRSDPNA